MSYQLSYVVRAPFYSSRDSSGRLLTLAQTAESMNRMDFATLLRLASEDLLRAALEGKSAKTFEKLRLYSLRASQRCTPFGAFAHIAVLNGSAVLNDHNANAVSLVARRIGRPEHKLTSLPSTAWLFQNQSIVLDGDAIYHHDPMAGSAPLIQSSRSMGVLKEFMKRQRWRVGEILENPKLFPLSEVEYLVDRGLIFVHIEPRRVSATLKIDAPLPETELSNLVSSKGVVNSFAQYSENVLSPEELLVVRSTCDKIQQKFSRQDRLYLDFRAYFRRFFNEGPVPLDKLAVVLGKDWQQFAKTDDQPSDALAIFLLERLQSEQADQIDLTEFAGTGWATPDEPICGSALLFVGGRDQLAYQINRLAPGTGTELMGRFAGDHPDVDKFLNWQRQEYQTATGSTDQVELVFRPDTLSHNVTNSKPIFDEQLVICDRFARPDACVHRLADFEILFNRNAPEFRERKSGRIVEIVVPHVYNHYSATVSPIFSVLAACARRRISPFGWPKELHALSKKPRLAFGDNIWLQGRTWKPTEEQLRELNATEPSEQPDWLRRRLKWLDNEEVSYVAGDSKLFFRQDDDVGLKTLARLLKKRVGHVEESFFGKFDARELTSARGGVTGEILVTYHRAGTERREVKFPAQGRQPVSADPSWLNFSIFVNADRLEGLLAGVVAPLVGHLRSVGLLRSWFYIRYNSGGNHVRLRLRAHKFADRSAISTIVERVLFVSLHQSSINTWTQDPFVPELIRYDHGNIEKIYDLFQADSDCAIADLQLAPNGSNRLTYDVVQIAARAFKYMELTAWGSTSCDEMLSKVLRSRFSSNRLPYLRDGEDRLFDLVTGKNISPTAEQFRQSVGDDTEPCLRPDQFMSCVHMAANRSLRVYNRDHEILVFRTLRAVQRRRLALTKPYRESVA